MSGYFSKIARQSGARVAGTSSTQRGPVEPAARLSPIDRNEVVMVEPDTAPTRKREAPKVESKAIPESQKLPVMESRGQTIETLGDPDPPRITNDAPLSSSQLERVATETTQLRADALSVLPAEEVDDVTRPEVPDTTVMIPPVESPTSPSPEKGDTDVDHFAETIKIVAGREVSKDEASSILVREIHQWIAAGATDAPELQVEEVVPRDHAVLRDKLGPQAIDEPEPGVVRIVSEMTRRQQKPISPEPRRGEQTTIEEQTLDLSIGTINVVIESDPAPPVAQQPPRSRPVEPPSPPTRSSRLRRSYL